MEGTVPHDARPAKIVPTRSCDGVEQESTTQGTIELMLVSHPVFTRVVVFFFSLPTGHVGVMADLFFPCTLSWC